MKLLEVAKIVLLGIVAAIVYGIAHDLVTANLSLEYFTDYHPIIVQTHSPIVLALVWGLVATWWAGAFLGTILALSSQAGPWPRIGWRRLLGPVSKLLAVMAGCATCAGIAGYIEGQWIADHVLEGFPEHPLMVSAVYCAHSASYAAGFLGSVTLAVWVVSKRTALAEAERLAP
jgi:hypothetical protein